MHHPVARLVDLLDPALNRLHNVDADEARRRVRAGDPAAVRGIDGSFALVTMDGITIRMARSMDRPMRYFLAKRHEGPALFVADRIDTLQRALDEVGFGSQFHPSYTRMVPAHYIVEIQLVGCPDPDPTYTRFFTPGRGTLPPDLDEIGRRYIAALSDEIAKWLQAIDRGGDSAAPIGVSFSGGIDSGSVFLLTYHTMLRLGMTPARL
ncbi:MAG: asparagine synthetase B family protein, partial [Vicinamibacterales bacterium]